MVIVRYRANIYFTLAIGRINIVFAIFQINFAVVLEILIGTRAVGVIGDNDRLAVASHARNILFALELFANREFGGESERTQSKNCKQHFTHFLTLVDNVDMFRKHKITFGLLVNSFSGQNFL